MNSGTLFVDQFVSSTGTYIGFVFPSLLEFFLTLIIFFVILVLFAKTFKSIYKAM